MSSDSAYMSFHHRPHHRYIVLAFLAGAFILLFDFLGFFEGVNNYCYDIYFRLKPTPAVHQRITIITVDDESLKKLGRWPLSRKYYASLLDHLGEADAVGFDILFDEESGDDEEFRSAIRHHGRVVIATHVDRYLKVQLPIFHNDSAGQGHAHVDQDVDGIVRFVFQEVVMGETQIPSLAKAMVAVSKKEKSMPPVRQSASDFLRQSERMGINYYDHVFRQVPLHEILLNDHYPPEFFTGKLVLVGVTATGLADIYPTPILADGHGMPGVVLQANILANLLDGTGMIRTSQWQEYVFFLLFYAVIMSCAFFFARLRCFSFFLGLFGLLLLISFAGHRWLHVWIAPGSLLFSCMSGFVCVWILRMDLMGQKLAMANKEWQDSFDSMTDAIVLHDRNGRLLKENSRSRELCHGIVADLLIERSQDLLAGNPVKNSVTIADTTLNKHLEIRSWLQLDREHRQVGVMHVVCDITEKKLMEIKEAALQAQLITAQRMEAVGSLAGGVAHDFNNVLTAILCYGEILSQSLADQPKLREHIRIILESGERGANLARQLLLFSRKKHTTKQVTYLGKIVENMLKMLGGLLGNNIKVVRDPGFGEGRIYADPTQVEQVVMNLVVNARDAMPNGGVLTLSLDEYTAESEEIVQSGILPAGRYIRLTVSDTGEGIAAEQFNHIFEPFYSTKEEGKGTGLGLATVYRIVKQHHGAIAVASEKGRGASFLVYFPHGEETSQESAGPEVQMSPRGDEHILLTEHDPVLGTMLYDILTPLGYKVHLTATGSEALAYGKEKEFDLLLTEVILPNISGKEIAEQVRHYLPSIKTLYISGYPEEALSRYGEWIKGKEFFLQKPITPGNLASRIRTILDG